MEKSPLLTTLGQPYTFVQLNSQIPIQSVGGDHAPIYLAPDNSPLNKFYQPITGPVTAVCQGKAFSENPFTKDKYPMIFRPALLSTASASSFKNDGFLKIPNPRDFSTQDEYVSSLSTWYRQAIMYFSSAMLPTPISGCFYLPSPPKIFTREEKASPSRYRTFKANLWPLLPKNYLHMIDLCLNKEEINPDELFPEQLPKREPILYKHHITQENQWMSQMIPVEPKPFVYDTFEDFEKAYLNWASFTYNSLEKPPIPPDQFGAIASLDRYAETDEEIRSRIGISFPKINLDNVDLSWSKKTNCIKTDRAGLCLQDLITQISKPSKSSLHVSPVLEVFGISNKNRFVSDMIEFGYYLGNNNDDKPAHPTKFYFGSYISTTTNVESLCINCRNINIYLAARILEYEMSQEQFNQLFNFSINKTKVSVIMSNLLSSPESMKILFSYSARTLRHPIRISYFLNAVFSNEPNNTIFNTLVMPQFIFMLNKTVYFLNLTSKYKVEMIPMIKNYKDGALMTINHFYILQTILTIFADYESTKFYRFILEQCRNREFEIARFMRREEPFLRRLREAPVDTDEYTVLLMLSQCESTLIHRLLLGSHFPKWLSEGPERPIFLWSLAHSTALNTAAYHFVKYCGVEYFKYVDSLSNSVCIFISYICKHLVDYGERIHFRFVGQTILPFLEAIIRSKNKYVNCILVPFTTLICSNKIISNLQTLEFKKLLIGLICKLCSKLVVAPPLEYINIIYSLFIFIRQQNHCPAMAQVPNFVETVVDHLADPDPRILIKSWTFFHSFTQSPKILELIFQKPKVKNSLVEIIRKENRTAHKKFYQFSTKIWKNADPSYAPLKKALCDIMMPAIGTIVCVYNTRFTAYKDDEKIRYKIEQFFSAIDQLNFTPGCQEFLQTIARHMADTTKAKK